MAKNKISVIINAKNEERFISDCLESVKWADEVLVFINPDSTDKTEEKARQFKTRIIEQKPREMNFAAWHNQGLKEAKGDWLLWVDADERIPPLLKSEIQTLVADCEATSFAYHRPPFTAYAILRRNFLLGKELKHGGWSPDYVKRLFKKKNLEKWRGELHEEPIFEGEMGYLKNPMIHLQPEKIGPALEKSIVWSGIEADLLFKAGHPPVTWWRVLRMGATTLFDRLIKKRGFLDGTEGWIESFYQAFHTMIIYVRLWELQREK
jgi:glycosyltransferase involved in cell wall biosynthesis